MAELVLCGPTRAVVLQRGGVCSVAPSIWIPADWAIWSLSSMPCRGTIDWRHALSLNRSAGSCNDIGVGGAVQSKIAQHPEQFSVRQDFTTTIFEQLQFGSVAPPRLGECEFLIDAGVDLSLHNETLQQSTQVRPKGSNPVPIE
jgi:hypothetical protein